MDIREGSCHPTTCQYHALTEAVVEDLKDAVHRLMEGQDQMKETVIKLAEAFKYMEKVEVKVDRLEERYRDAEKETARDLAEKNEKQDLEIDRIKMFMYKSMGAGSLAMTALTYSLSTLGGE